MHIATLNHDHLTIQNGRGSPIEDWLDYGLKTRAKRRLQCLPYPLAHQDGLSLPVVQHP